MSHRLASIVSLAVLPSALALVAACAGAQAPSAEPPAIPAASAAPTAAAAPGATDAKEPVVALSALEAREVTTGLSRQVVKTLDGLFTADVETTTAPEIKKEGATYVLTVPLGTRSPVECDLIPGRIDTAGALARRVREIGKSVKITKAAPVDVAVAGGGAVLFAEATYEVVTDGKPMRGVAKLAARSDDGMSIMCMHNEVGYAATFARVALEIAAGSKPKTKVASTYTQIDVLKVAGHPIGFSEMIVSDDKSGGKLVDTRDAILAPTSPTELSGVDHEAKILVDRAGVTLGGSFVKLQDGVQQASVTLLRGKGNEYSAKGKAAGTDLNASFKSPRVLTTEYSRAKSVQKFLAGKDVELSFSEYAPDADPKTSVDIVMKKQDGGVVVTRGQKTAKIAYDAAGLPRAVEINVGGSPVTGERIHTTGTP